MQKLKARVLVDSATQKFPPGAITKAARNVPVTVDFDHRFIVGYATVFPDGTAELQLMDPSERTLGSESIGLGFVVEQFRDEPGTDGERLRVYERIKPMAVSISSGALESIRQQKKV